MSHNTPQPGEKTGWYENEEGILTRDWDDEDDGLFMNYCDAFDELGKPDLIERYKMQKLFDCPDRVLNRMAGRLAKLAGGNSSGN